MKAYLIDAARAATSALILRNHSSLFRRKRAAPIFIRFDSPGLHHLVFEHRRPWNKQKLAQIDISIDNNGKEVGGFARRFRERALAAAVGA